MNSNPYAETIDFSKYGLNWVIDDTTKTIPDSFFDNISKVNGSGNTITLTPVNGEPFTFQTVKKLGAGSFGVTYLIDKKIENTPTVVKVIDMLRIKKENLKEYIYDTIQEVLTQIIIYEASKDINIPEIGLVGPFSPRFFYLGKNDTQLFILMEHLDVNLQNALDNKMRNYSWKPPTSQFIKTTTLQISKILDILYKRLNFNHRDLKPDNIMYKIINDSPNIRLIDFGFSCLKYKNLKLKALSREEFASGLTSCSSNSRDLHSYFFYLLNYTHYKSSSCPVKRVINTLSVSNENAPYEWANTYKKFNKQNDDQSKTRSENLAHTVVYNVFSAIDFERPTDECSNFGVSWASHLVKLYDNTVRNLTDDEYLQVPDDVLRPFLEPYLNFEIGNLWKISKDTNALLTSFSYKLNGNNRKFLPVPADLINPLLMKFINSYNITVADSLGETILHKIARNPNFPKINDILDTVLEKGRSNQRFLLLSNSQRKTAFEIAIEHDYSYAIEKLSEFINILDSIKDYPNSYKYEIISKLITVNPAAFMEKRSQDKGTFLHIIAQTEFPNSRKLLELFLSKNPPLEYLQAFNSFGNTAMDYAIRTNNIYAIEHLFDFDIKINEPKFLFNLAFILDSPLVDRLFEKYYNPEYLNYANPNTPTIFAIQQHNFYLAKKLVEKGAKTGFANNLGKTALHYAAINASELIDARKPVAFDLVKLLIDKNPALPNMKNKSKKGPANPNYVKNASVRNYIKSRKSTLFTKRKNTNSAGGTRKRRG